MLYDYLESPSAYPSRPQVGMPLYLPQRLPEDGVIDWSLSSETISRFIKALTKPYPGAFFKEAASIVKIWRADPIDLSCDLDGSPGQIVFVTSQNEFIVKTGTGYLFVEEWEGLDTDWMPLVGKKLIGEDACEQLKIILNRHISKYPNALPNPIFYSILEKGFK